MVSEGGKGTRVLSRLLLSILVSKLGSLVVIRIKAEGRPVRILTQVLNSQTLLLTGQHE